MRQLSFLIWLVFAAIYAHPARAEFMDCVFFDGFEARGTSDAAQLAALELHNCARKTATPPPAPPMPMLTWSTSAATFAQGYANGCIYQHSDNPTYGENIYAYATTGSGEATLSDATLSWLSEEPYYNYANNTCSGSPSGTCGHYTQIVWRDTTQVGCGLAYCTANSPFGAMFPNWTFVVCDYLPPGNFIGDRPY